MTLTGIHLLITYQCLLECDHCFVWSNPSLKWTMKLQNIRRLIQEAKTLGTVKWIYFEGGEPFLYYPIMVRMLREAAESGFQTGIVTNGYWATSVEDATEWLIPVAKTGITDLSISSDRYHGENTITEEARNGVNAAKKLGIPVGIISVDVPSNLHQYPSEVEGAPVSKTELMYRGRAASKLLEAASRRPWTDFTKCPYEDLANPQRVHVDPLGYVHVCQGISIGNAWQRTFSEIIRSYNPSFHPIIRPLLEAGPVALVKKFHLPNEDTYADACHLCYLARLALRDRFPEYLAPAQMYGEASP